MCAGFNSLHDLIVEQNNLLVLLREQYKEIKVAAQRRPQDGEVEMEIGATEPRLRIWEEPEG